MSVLSVQSLWNARQQADLIKCAKLREANACTAYKNKRDIVMLQIKNYGPVTLFYMGRSPLGFLLYPVHAFLVGDMLIDTGTNRVDKQFLSALTGQINRKDRQHPSS